MYLLANDIRATKVGNYCKPDVEYCYVPFFFFPQVTIGGVTDNALYLPMLLLLCYLARSFRFCFSGPRCLATSFLIYKFIACLSTDLNLTFSDLVVSAWGNVIYRNHWCLFSPSLWEIWWLCLATLCYTLNLLSLQREVQRTGVSSTIKMKMHREVEDTHHLFCGLSSSLNCI